MKNEGEDKDRRITSNYQRLANSEPGSKTGGGAVGGSEGTEEAAPKLTRVCAGRLRVPERAKPPDAETDAEVVERTLRS